MLTSSVHRLEQFVRAAKKKKKQKPRHDVLQRLKQIIYLKCFS